MLINIDNIPNDQTVLIAGPTASGKSSIALEIAAKQGGIIINADALQVFANWHVLTARPSRDEESLAPHALYGHVAGDFTYSVGHWLRDVTPYLTGDKRPIIVGGTGLYFTALTEGLADIPPTPDATRKTANTMETGDMLAKLDAKTVARIDVQNPMRVQRAWEVLTTTGKGLAQWQDETPPPLLALKDAHTILLEADKEWLSARIERRFDGMIANGALSEARENLATWDPDYSSSKAIGAPELIAHLKGELTLDEVRERSKIATRQYAKRQRTWFKSRMKSWNTAVFP